MANKATRVAALVIALLFFVSSLGFSGLVMWQVWKDNKAKQTTADVTKALDETKKPQTKTNEQPKEGKLQGTKLQDFTPVTAVDELKSTDIKEGTGDPVQPGATITAHYTGALAKDGTIFESSRDSGKPATFPLSGVIQGWQQGVPGMKVGGVRRLVIPAALAYGEKGSAPTIGPNEPLVFDIELVEIKPAQ